MVGTRTAEPSRAEHETMQQDAISNGGDVDANAIDPVTGLGNPIATGHKRPAGCDIANRLELGH